jgi:hypothetical protein
MHAAGVLGDVAADRCRRSATTDRARNRGRRAPPPRRSPGCARPGCTTAVRASGSIARMRLNLASDSTTPCACGSGAARQAGAGAARDHRHLAVRGRRGEWRRPAPRLPAARPAAATVARSMLKRRSAIVSSMLMLHPQTVMTLAGPLTRHGNGHAKSPALSLIRSSERTIPTRRAAQRRCACASQRARSASPAAMAA